MSRNFYVGSDTDFTLVFELATVSNMWEEISRRESTLWVPNSTAMIMMVCRSINLKFLLFIAIEYNLLCFSYIILLYRKCESLHFILVQPAAWPLA